MLTFPPFCTAPAPTSILIEPDLVAASPVLTVTEPDAVSVKEGAEPTKVSPDSTLPFPLVRRAVPPIPVTEEPATRLREPPLDVWLLPA